MRSFPAGPNRAQFGFAEAVRRSFHFLLDAGFSITEETTTLVRFESEHIIVHVYHGRSSYMLGVEIGRRAQASDREIRHSLHDIVMQVDRAKFGNWNFQISSPDRMVYFVQRLADVTRRYTLDALMGDRDAFERLTEYVRRTAKENTDAYAAYSLREKADSAWRDHDFACVINAYSALDELDTIELKRPLRSELDLIMQRKC